MHGHLTDTILISNPAISEVPKFSNIADSLIYIVHHDSQGAIGVRLNKNYSKTVADIGNTLSEFSLLNDSHLLTNKTIFGGPVGPDIPWILGRNKKTYPQQIRNSSLSLNFFNEAFKENLPNHFSVCGIGTFGWGEGQLEKEMASFLWHHFPATPILDSIPFDSDYLGATQLILTMKFDSSQ